MNIRKRVLLVVLMIFAAMILANWIVGQDNSKDVPFGPKHFQVKDYGNTWITVTWQDKADNEDGFDIYVKGAGSPHIIRISGVAPGVDLWREYTVTGLEPGTVHQLKIRAYNSFGESPWGNDVVVQTKDDKNHPPRANCINGQGITPTSGLAPLTVLFDLSKTTDKDGQVVKIFIDFGDGEQQEFVGAALLTTIIHQYPEGTYKARITAWDDDGAMDTCTATIRATTEPNPFDCGNINGSIESIALLSEFINPETNQEMVKVKVQFIQKKVNKNIKWVFWKRVYDRDEYPAVYWTKKNQWLYKLDETQEMDPIKGEFSGATLKHSFEIILPKSSQERRLKIVAMSVCCYGKFGYPWGPFVITIPPNFPDK